MKRVLIPVTDSPESLDTVRATVARGRSAIDAIDLISVQPRFSKHVAEWIPKRVRDEWREEQAEKAFAPARQIIESAGIACRVHMSVGQSPHALADLARLIGANEVIETPRGPLAKMAVPAGIGLGLGAAVLMIADE